MPCKNPLLVINLANLTTQTFAFRYRDVSDAGGDRYHDDPYADARPMNDADRFARGPAFDDRMRQTPSPSGIYPTVLSGLTGSFLN